VIGDGGDVANLAAGVIKPAPGHWLDPGPLGILGIGMPFARAAKTAFPDKDVVSVFGMARSGSTASNSTRPCATSCRCRRRRQQSGLEHGPLR
jgi:hypothetical protein